MNRLVTIGVPTYERPETLRRALASVARQTYPYLEVIVADNAPSDPRVTDVIESARQAIPGLVYVRHQENIGPLANFMFLLDVAQGEYFMWLADDDEVSANYVASLVDLLDADRSAATATGHWRLMVNEKVGSRMRTSHYQQRSALVRALRFIWSSDDAFFYGLHRLSVLRQARFPGYWPPNRAALSNWAYVFLLDVVLRGRILLTRDETVEFINHDYTDKTYRARHVPVARALKGVLRRVNVHYLYWRQCAGALSPVAMPLVIGVSLLALFRESASTVLRTVHLGRRRS